MRDVRDILRRTGALAILTAALFAAVVVWSCVPAGVARAEEGPDEDALRAALVYNITRFVTWPESAFTDAGAPLVIGVLGDHPILAHLQRVVVGRVAADARPFEIVPVDDLASAARCHVLFFPSRAAEANRHVLEALDASAVLLVGDDLRFVESEGGAIALVRDERRIRIVLDKSELAESGLMARAQLLRLCTVVEGDAAR